jgi:hypothetical protein
MLDFIDQNGLKDPNLFKKTGDPEQMEQIRYSLDSNDPFPEDTTIHSMADILIEWLKVLSESFLPIEILDQYCIMYVQEGTTDDGICRKFVEALPPTNQRCFVYFISFLNHLLSHRQFNKLTTEHLVTYFTDALTQSDVYLEK